MSVTQFSQTETYNAADVNAVIAQLLALDGSTTMTGTLLQSPLNVLRKAGQTGQEEIWYEYAGDPAYIQIVRNAYYSGGWKAKYPWDDGVNYLHPCRIIIGNYGKLYFEHAVGPSGGVDSAITWETGDINGRQFLSDAASGTPPFVVASATQVPNLNADMVDGYDAGNAAGNVPVSNGVLNTNLNAHMVGGRYAGNGSGAVPISNGTVNTNLNADMVDGMQGIQHQSTETVVADYITPTTDAWTNLSLPAILQGKKVLFLMVRGRISDANADLAVAIRPGGETKWSSPAYAPGTRGTGTSIETIASGMVILSLNGQNSIDYYFFRNSGAGYTFPSLTIRCTGWM